MLSRRDTTLPIPAVRDVLGIVCAMYRAESAAKHPSSTKLARLRKVGASLTTPLELASASTPGTVGHRATWQHADEAIEAIGQEITMRIWITMLETLEQVLVAARRAASAGRKATVRTKKPGR